MSQSPARSLLNKIDGTKFPGNSPVRASYDTCLSNFLAHLKWLKNRHCPKNYSDQHLVSVLFKSPGKFKSDSEKIAYCRSHLSVATDQFEKLITNLKNSKGQLTAHTVKKNTDQIRDYLHDLRPIAQELELRKNPNYSFFDGGKYYGAMGFQIYNASIELSKATKKNPVKLDHKLSQIASVFILRQALEIMFQRIIAVYFHDSMLQTPKLRHEFHYEFIKKNLDMFEFIEVDFKLLKKIYSWCNFSVHTATQPLVWQLSYAHQITSGLFATGQLHQKGGWSIHGGIRILDLKLLQEKFIEHFNKQNKSGNIYCVHCQKPEAVHKYYDA